MDQQLEFLPSPLPQKWIDLIQNIKTLPNETIRTRIISVQDEIKEIKAKCEHDLSVRKRVLAILINANITRCNGQHTGMPCTVCGVSSVHQL